jgi:hypothetical protein
LFKNLKTAGFDWEKTHMKDPKRLTKLLIILELATVLVMLVGFQSSIPWKKLSTTRYIRASEMACYSFNTSYHNLHP